MHRHINLTYSLILAVLIGGVFARPLCAADSGDDAAAAKQVAIKYMVASAVGDVAAVKAVSTNSSPEVDESMAAALDMNASGRELEQAAFNKFGSSPAPKTPQELTQALQSIDVQVRGDAATVRNGGRIVGSLKRVDGQWKVDAKEALGAAASPAALKATTLMSRIATRVNREVAGETAAGKYSSLGQMMLAVKEKARAAAQSDQEYLDAARAARAARSPAPPQATGAGPAAPPAVHRAAVDTQLPAGAIQSDQAGGKGGSPFVHVSPNQALVTGFHYSMGKWRGKPVLRQLDPVFLGDANALPPAHGDAAAQTLAAREGYIVGEMQVDSDGTNAVAVKVTFFRLKEGNPDPSDHYTSDWIGTPTGGPPVQMGGKGERVIGTFGHKGMNLDAVGLVLLPAQPAPSK